MGRGRSGTTAAYTQMRVDGSGGASSRTVQAVEAAIAGRNDDSSREVREALASIREGQSITLYSAEFSGTSEVNGVANDLTVWTKQGDGTWLSDNAQRKDNSDLARNYYNAGYGRKLAPGRQSTESYVSVDESGRGGAMVDGMRWNNGTYDVQARGAGAQGTRKVMYRGKIATYNGTQYATTKIGGEYSVTHVPTGLRVGGAKTLKGATDVVRQMDKQVHNIAGLSDMERRFAKTLRGD